MEKRIQRLFDRLLAAYGPQQWWPATTPFEMMIGAILTQNTAWTNVERAIDALKTAEVLDAESLMLADENALQQWIRPTGYFRQKAARLRCLARFYIDCSGIEAMRRIPPQAMRKRLLMINGIGPETADSILLYALQQPVFVIDSYTKRLLSRLGIVDASIRYDDLQALFHANLPHDLILFQEYHALIVVHAKQHCLKKPLCAGCPATMSLACEL